VDFSTLTGATTEARSIRSWVNHAAIPADEILIEAQQWIFKRLRHWRMRFEATGTLAIGDDTLALPDGFVAPISLIMPRDYPNGLPYRDEQLFHRYRDEDGVLLEGPPTMWTIMDELIMFDQDPDEEIDYIFWFYGTPEVLSLSNPTNFLTDEYPTLLRRTCTMLGYEYRKDWTAAERQ
jgi:hypothetical protein